MPTTPEPDRPGGACTAPGAPAPIRPTAGVVVESSVNHRLPSAPAAISTGMLPLVKPLENSVIAPAGVIRPIAGVAGVAGVPGSVNHTFPSGPAAIPPGLLPLVKPVVNSVIAPSGVIRPISPGLTDVGEPQVPVRRRRRCHVARCL